MALTEVLSAACALAPFGLMLAASVCPMLRGVSVALAWRAFRALSGIAAALAAFAAFNGPEAARLPAGLLASPFGLALAVVVQVLGSVIGAFSARYLQGEPGQARYVGALAGVLAAVHLLLVADHWVVLIAAWALVGLALERLLCFYADRPFARLAAHKKRIADRAADVLLAGAAALAWVEVGSGSLTDLWAHVASHGMSTSLEVAAMLLALAVVLRSALLPVHGWLIQVMEAPTPVSALLHAGVVNLGGFVLIRFAPLLSEATPARILLVVAGLATAVLAGMVMLTRISIKVRLAWSTAAQMGFMILECGLGLYTLAALHLIGHSLYKAHAFLAASGVVRDMRLRALHAEGAAVPGGLLLAPLVGIGLVAGLQAIAGVPAWPWWWSVVLGLGWAPLLWIRSGGRGSGFALRQAVAGLLAMAGLTVLMLLAHRLPFGLADVPHEGLGILAMVGMGCLYAALAALQRESTAMHTWRRWSYAGFYVDEVYTRFALSAWPSRWASDSAGRTAVAIAPLGPARS